MYFLETEIENKLNRIKKLSSKVKIVFQTLLTLIAFISYII